MPHSGGMEIEMDASKLYTGNGDRGYTSIAGNRHISKADELVKLLGTIDEYTSALGLAKAETADAELRADIEAVQKKLVGIMGELAGGKPSVEAECIAAVEGLTDKYCPEFGGFTLPGANRVSAALDFARTVIRRAERTAARLLQLGRIRNITYVYINRLSDLTYAMASYAAKSKGKATAIKVAAGSSESDGLTLELCKELALAVERRAEDMGKRIVVAIVDGGAKLVLLHAMHDSYIASVQIAQDKAYTAVSLKMPTHTALEESRGGALDGLTPTDNNRLMLLGGGYPLVINSKIVGGIGVSGGTAEEDTAFAEFGAMYLERRLSL